MKSLLRCFATFTLSLVFLSQARAQQPPPPLLQLLPQTDSLVAPKDPTVIRSLNVLVDFNRLTGEQKRTLSLPLFDGTTLNLVLDRRELVTGRDKPVVIWRGKVDRQPGSSITLSMSGDALVGNITTQDARTYQIRYIKDGIHSLREMNPAEFPNEAPPIRPQLPLRDSMQPDACSTDPPAEIDVMVVYTAAARAGAGGPDAMVATVYLAVAEANQAYENSQIAQRIRLVHTAEVVYTESGNINTDLDRLRNGSDGFMDNVPTLRNTFAADMVSLITENGGGYCGLAYMMQTISSAFESYAYSVVARNCATGYYSFAHELGHNMGADHDCSNSSSTGPYSYNRGWYNTAPTAPATPWRTIMAYNTTPSSTRVQYFSNPNVSFPIGGDPMGATCASDATKSADNHQVLNNSASTVANFRCSSPSALNVWMKDTWNDTGQEPDPNTATDPMWQSPYIWVRNAQDPGLVHQHEHQNPVSGSANWVYVKLHNGFNNTTSGTLELYWANASTGLSWPSGWNLLTTVSITGFAAHSTRIAEAQWPSPPAPGHYCLIARWVSAADPMTTAETADINANTKANNNIIWRNLNIINLSPDRAVDANLIVRNPSREQMATSLVIRPPEKETEKSFTRLGQVSIQLDKNLLQAWKKGGSKGTGFRMEGNSIVITAANGAVLDNLLLAPGASGNLRLRFRQLKQIPESTYLIEVIQLRTKDREASRGKLLPGAIGGVSYEIHTGRQTRSGK